MDCIVRLSAPLTGRRDPATGLNLKRQVRKELEQLFATHTRNRKS